MSNPDPRIVQAMHKINKLRMQKAELRAEQKKIEAEEKEVLKALASVVRALGLKNLAVDGVGTFYQSEIKRTKVADWEAIQKASELLHLPLTQNRLSTKTYQEVLDAVEIPGVAPKDLLRAQKMLRKAVEESTLLVDKYEAKAK